jgi:hypothetical protein
VLLPFTVRDLDPIVPQILAGERPVSAVTMAQATLNTGETLCGVNDLFIGPRSHTSARYTLRSGGRSERHSSSGIIVSTGLGSTGWFRSIVTGATGIAAALSGGTTGGTAAEATGGPTGGTAGAFPWDARYLYFSVREPWPSTTSAATVTFGKVTPTEPLVLVSHMPENGVIFSDGMEADFLQFNAGTEATITLAGRAGRLVR